MEKKTAVLLYQGFCNFEISVALEMLFMAKRQITTFAASKAPVVSEEGLSVVPDKTLEELEIEDYDSILVTGSMDLTEAITDARMMEFLRQFDREGVVIGAISAGPMLLLQAGLLEGRRYMAGVDKEWFLEENGVPVHFTMEEMSGMVEWKAIGSHPECKGFLKDGNLITSVCYWFREWAMEFGRMLGIPVYPGSFGEDMMQKQ